MPNADGARMRGDELTTLPCFHSFHTACCRQWLQQSGTCPVCKHRIDDTAFPAEVEAEAE